MNLNSDSCYLNFRTTKSTPEKRKKFSIPKTLRTGSVDISDAGSIKTIDPQIPRAQTKEISEDDFLFQIL